MEFSEEKQHKRFERLRRMRNATYANIGIAAGTGLGFLLTGNPVFGGEAGHSGADGILHGLRYQAERRGYDQDTTRFRLFLAGSLAVPAAFLLHHSYETYHEFLDAIKNGNNNTLSPVTSIASGIAIGGANIYAFYQTSKIEEHSDASHATHKHAITDAVVSGGFVVTLFIEAAGVQNASLVGGAAFSGIAGAHLGYESVRTALNKNHHGHNHEHSKQ
jgi:divalent metal cation (Fe/Co/Zn/Cd) transporter